MEDIAGWIAPIATTLAAMMTAGNFGTRVTGWGFAVFTIGSLAWCAVALASDQANLLWTNGFLTFVNLVGIWRWLGRRAKFDEGARTAAISSRTEQVPSLFSVASICDGSIRGRDGSVIGHGIDAMAECESGRISYVMMREGGAAGVGERLHALAWDDVRRCGDGFETDLDAGRLAALPVHRDGEWPAAAPKAG